MAASAEGVGILSAVTISGLSALGYLVRSWVGDIRADLSDVAHDLRRHSELIMDLGQRVAAIEGWQRAYPLRQLGDPRFGPTDPGSS